MDTEDFTLLGRAFPSLHDELLARGLVPEVDISPGPRTYEKLLELAPRGAGGTLEAFKRALRRFALTEKARIASRELGLGDLGRADVRETSREVSDLASVVIVRALEEACAWADERFGAPLDPAGQRIACAIWGMGKLGGWELNVGSDVDLIPVYDTDEGACAKSKQTTPHEYFTRVVQRMVLSLEEATEDGIVFRVDLRLRPEGTRGPLVNSIAAMESYYETWGRTWERAALLRARTVAGDLAFGASALQAISPFVWRKAVVPSLSTELAELLLRSRLTADGGERNIKLGKGGIREVEFFAQSLALIWGGKDSSLRVANTWDLLDLLAARGLVTLQEATTLAAGYRFLRRAEHAIQFAVGRPTHALPTTMPLQDALSFATGFTSWEAFETALEEVRRQVHALYQQNLFEEAPRAATPFLALWEALDADDEARVRELLGTVGESDLPRHLLTLSSRPNAPLGVDTRAHYPKVAEIFTAGILGAPEPERCALSVCRLFARFSDPSPVLFSFNSDLAALDKVLRLLGASPFLSDALVARPLLLGDLFGATTSAPSAQELLDEEVALVDPTDVEAFIGALRRTRSRDVLRIAEDDLAGTVDARTSSRRLTELAETQVAAALEHARKALGIEVPMVVVGMGKLGGNELSYGSDLDLFFLHDGGESWDEKCSRAAQRTLRLLSIAHGDGPGYELDTRLRPSGAQGLLVVSFAGFVEHHMRSEPWERQALIKGRPIAGHSELRDRTKRLMEEVAYLRPAPAGEEIARIRARMERELSLDQAPNRFDLKLGYGGLVDIEFATQYLQMVHGQDERVRSVETEAALDALLVTGNLDAHAHDLFSDAFRRYRLIERMLRLGTSRSRGPVVERGRAPIAALARLGVPDTADEGTFFAVIGQLRKDVRDQYLRILGSSRTS